MDDEYFSVPLLGPQLKEIMENKPVETKVVLHQRMFLYHAKHGAKLFAEDEPLPTEPGWCDSPKAAAEFKIVEAPRLPEGAPVTEPDHEHGERTDRGRTTRHRRP
ncbi:MAG: hypothetical protein ABT940_13120 [Alphaproteobacteria bacterium]